MFLNKSPKANVSDQQNEIAQLKGQLTEFERVLILENEAHELTKKVRD